MAEREHWRDRQKPQTALQRTFVAAVRESDLEVAELARRSGMTRQYVSEMLHGRTRGSLVSWEALLAAAGVEVGYRIPGPPPGASADPVGLTPTHLPNAGGGGPRASLGCPRACRT